MKAVGITAEYNPLQNGHVYHIEKARELSSAECVVVAMSGNFVQRGEPAIFDKWKRTEHALKCGADLVVEIPVLFCLGNAGQYAEASVRILESLGKVTHIAFGSECGDTDLLARTASDLKNYSSEIHDAIGNMRGTGLSYPAARERAFMKVMTETPRGETPRGETPRGEAPREEAPRGEAPAAFHGNDSGSDEAEFETYLENASKLLKSSNDILALEYIMALEKAIPLAITRRGASYSSGYEEGQEFQSATAIRNMILNGNDITGFVPECVSDYLKNDNAAGDRICSFGDMTELSGACGIFTGVDMDKWFDTLKYAILSSSPEMIDDCPSGGEGLGNRIIKEAAVSKDLDDLIKRVQSKRYTYTRISRLFMQILLGINRKTYSDCIPSYVRILGFNEKGRRLLAEIRSEESASFPVITNINKEAGLLDDTARKLLDLEIHSSDIYNLMCGKDIRANSDNLRRPVIL